MAGQGEEQGEISTLDVKFALLCVWGGDMEYGMAFAGKINQVGCMQTFSQRTLQHLLLPGMAVPETDGT